MEYRKKPVVIEAFMYGVEPIPDWFMGKVTSNEIILHVGTDIRDSSEYYCEIKTLEGVMKCDCRDYIIKGVKGEIYPCKPDIFHMTYELLDDHIGDANKMVDAMQTIAAEQIKQNVQKLIDKDIFDQAILAMEEMYGSGCETEIDAYFRGAKWMEKQFK